VSDTDSTQISETAYRIRNLLGGPAPSLVRWFGIVGITTAALWWYRAELDKAHMGMIFLLIVLGGSARHGRKFGFLLAISCFLSFTFFLLPPYHTFIVANPLDWLVLFTFLITSGVAAQLLYRAQHEAQEARLREQEMDRLSTLGAETLNVVRADEAVQAIARVLQATLRIGICEVYRRDPNSGDLERIACSASPNGTTLARSTGTSNQVEQSGRMPFEWPGATYLAGRSTDSTRNVLLPTSRPATEFIIPLEVRGHAVGVLRIADHQPISLDASQQRFAAVLSYYAALGVERVRLVSEEERADALQQADRLKDAFLASVSHDIRTPLTTIRALAHELTQTGDDRAHTIVQEADRLNRLVADLLDLSSINAGALPMQPEIAAAEDVVGAALQRLSGVRGAHRIQVFLGTGDTLPVGRFDLRHVLRILVNLLENALKYSPSPSPVEVEVRTDGERLTLAVLDRGPGVPPGEAERIFEPFYRRPGAPPDSPGTGLGLAIARQLARAQGGNVEYEPRAGGGSAFLLHLPAAEITGM
jgi:two-component system, OmpR family, sensor histidine kinase KdpD